MKMNLSKKVLSVLVAITMLVGIGSMTMAYAASDVTFTVSAPVDTVNVGDIVTVDVNISADNNAAGVHLILNYDDTKLKVLDEDPNEDGTKYPVAPDWTGLTSINVAAAGKVTIAYAASGEPGCADGGCILRVQFKVLEGASGEIPLTVDVSEVIDDDAQAMNALTADVVNGKITVKASSGESTTEPTTVEPTTAETTTKNSTTPPTGDNDISIFAVVMLFSAAVLVVVAASRKKAQGK